MENENLKLEDTLIGTRIDNGTTIALKGFVVAKLIDYTFPLPPKYQIGKTNEILHKNHVYLSKQSFRHLDIKTCRVVLVERWLSNIE